MNIVDLYIFSILLSGTIGKNIAASKEPKYTYDDILFTPKEKENINVDYNFDINSINFGKNTKTVKDFCIKLEEIFTPEELALFYNNLKQLKIKRFFNIFTSADGKYDAQKNVITLYSFNPKNLTHELFHSTGSYFIETDDYIFIATGLKKYFIIYNNKIVSVGTGINEGYTELLNFRYQKGNKFVYREQRKIVEALEMIISQYKMERYYLKADLNTLVDTLVYYSSQEDTMNFLYNTDVDVKYYFTLLFKRPKIRDEVRKYLLNCYANKLLEDYKNQMITKKELEKNLLDYACLINRKFLFKETFSTQYFSELLKNMLNETLFKNNNTYIKKK